MVYREMESADRLVIASPLQFMSVSAQLKALIDRCQALWARKYILKIPPLGDNRPRKGFFDFCRRSTDHPQPVRCRTGDHQKPLPCYGCTYAGDILLPGIDAKGDILKHPEALEQAYQQGRKFLEDP